jgi:hypothetical protein
MQKRYPFKFLDSYQKEDKDFFFGRTEEIDSLYKMIFQTRLLLVFGTSGTGKTSLIQCGLANKFEAYDWLALYIRRGGDLNASLDKSLCDQTDGAFTFVDQKPDEHVIKDLSLKISAVYNASLRPVYLIFDQFEELYVLGSNKEQEHFIQMVKEILAIEQPIKIIISIREEYLGYLYEFEKEVPQLLRKKLRVEPMTLDKLANVIKGIDDYKNSLVDIKTDEISEITKGIFERLKGEEKTLTIQLPYLQVFLDKLYMNITGDEKHEKDAVISLEELNKVGSFADVLQDFLEEQVKVISRDLSTKKNKVTPEIIWSILSEFCSLEGTKEPISKKQLSDRLESNLSTGLIDKSIEAFQNSRIIKKSDEEDLYELYHDTLALKIADKRSEDDISKLEVKRLIKSKAALTGELQELFTEKQLNFIEPYEKKIGSELTEDEKKLIKKSRKAIRIKRRNKRLGIGAGFLAILLVIAFFGIKGNMQLEQDKISQNISALKNLVASADLDLKESSKILDVNPTLALQLDLEALKKIDSGIMDSVKWKSLVHSNFYKTFSFWPFPQLMDEESKPLDTIFEVAKFEIRKHSDSIAQLDHALFKIIPFETRSFIFDSSFVNIIFPDKKEDTKFKLWQGSQKLIDSIKKQGELRQVLFPRDDSENLQEAMALYTNGKARYWGNNPNYRALDTAKGDRITSIAPIQYNVIGFKMLAAMNRKRIVEWNLNGTQRYNFHNELKTEPVTYITRRNVELNETVVSIAITLDRERIFTASDKGIGTIWEANTSTIDLRTDPKNAFNMYQEGVICSAFSNDGSMIATGSKDHKVKIWNTDTGDLIKEFKGHLGPVTSVAFSANNMILYTASVDGSVRKWSLASIDPITKKAKKPWNQNVSFDNLFREQIIDSIPYVRPKKRIETLIPSGS